MRDGRHGGHTKHRGALGGWLMLGALWFVAGDGEAAGQAGTPQAATREITFQAADGITVWADLVRSGEPRPLILLFHQGGGDARGEYAPILPELIARGFDAMTVDLRSGGDVFGGVNRTVEGLPGEEYGYCEAALDVAAALDFALGLPDVAGKPILWGSSFSAALVIRLAAERGDDVSGVLAFSPATGEPMAGCMPDDAARRLTVPALALRPAREASIPFVTEQLRAMEEAGVETFVPAEGVHGSSTLDPSRAPDAAATWAVVDRFLARFLRASGPRYHPSA